MKPLATGFNPEVAEASDTGILLTALDRFGRQATVEMSGIVGYYTHLALIMLAHRVPGNASG